MSQSKSSPTKPNPAKPAVLITGASSGIGATYADRFAHRGHDLVLVARDVVRLEGLKARLVGETGVAVDILPADLTNARDVEKVEQRLTEDARIGILVNNAGTTLPGTFVEQAGADVARLIALNVTAVARLANAAAARFAREGRGAIVNIGSVVGLAPELGWSVYGATKAFVQFLTQSLHTELAPRGVYLQAVLPSATRTEIWDHAGKDVATLPAVMEVGDLVDAALVGFDRRELITIPPLPDDAQFTAMDAARAAMVPNFMQAKAAPRYRAA